MRNLPGTWKYTGQKEYCCWIYSVFRSLKLTTYVCIYSMRPASERPVQPRSQCYKWRGWQFNTKRSPPPTGCVLSPKHHSHVQGKICLTINISHVMWFVRDSLCDRFWFFFLPQSDTPYRRSFTVLDNIGQGRPGRASVGTGQKFNLIGLMKNVQKVAGKGLWYPTLKWGLMVAVILLFCLINFFS